MAEQLYQIQTTTAALNQPETIRVYVVGNGCDRRLLDSSKLKHYFEANAAEIVNSPRNADYIFLNTCAMSKIQEDTSVSLIKKFEQYDAELIVHGCLPAIAPTRFRQEFSGPAFDSKNLDAVDALFEDFKISFKDVDDTHTLAQDRTLLSKFFAKFEWSHNFFAICWIALKFKLKNWHLPLHPRLRKGAYLQISRGCAESCSYCAIPRAVGTIVSKPIDDCIQEYKTLLANGERKFVFTADNIGLYGIDIKGSFASLIKRLSIVDQNYDKVKWIISELHPRWADRYQEALIPYIESGKITELCVPIQSGNDRVLTLMKRHHDTASTLRALQAFRQANPKLFFNTDVIIGFPGETDEEFLDSIRMVTRARFDQVQLFAYAARENTPAASMTSSLSKQQMLRRLSMATRILDKAGIAYVYQ